MKLESLLRERVQDDYGTQKLQNIILNIMKYIDRLCSENNIEYYIIGGTALGAIRHGGFIPWDDDLDIAMTRENYNRFAELCRSDKFDSEHFYYQQAMVDYIGYISKVRLLGTFFGEVGEDGLFDKDKMGIFVDVFPLDKVPDCKLSQLWWYFCGKLLVAYEQQSHIGYKTDSFTKKVIMLFAFILNNDKIRKFFERQVEKYNDKDTGYLGGHSLVSRFHNTFSKKNLWGKPQRIPFENITLLAPEDTEGFLSFYFGDFMKLPPEDSRRGHHMQVVDYGEYC